MKIVLVYVALSLLVSSAFAAQIRVYQVNRGAREYFAQVKVTEATITRKAVILSHSIYPPPYSNVSREISVSVQQLSQFGMSSSAFAAVSMDEKNLLEIDMLHDGTFEVSKIVLRK